MIRGSGMNRGLLIRGSAFILLLGLTAALFSLAVPTLISRKYDQRSLWTLQHQSLAIGRAFSAILNSIEERITFFEANPLSEDPRDVFGLFQKAGLDPDTEGVALADWDGNMDLWLGHVIDLREVVPGGGLRALADRAASFLIKDKSSVVLTHLQSLPDRGTLLVHFKLLAFIPQFQSSYVLESHALSREVKISFDIQYLDFEEDVSGFERLFDQNPDGYSGQPRGRNEIQTLFFPLRNEAGRILANVTLLSPSLATKLSAVREFWVLVIGCLLVAAGLLALLYLWTSPAFLREGDFLTGLLVILLTFSLRLVFFRLETLETLHAKPIFSPVAAGFVSVGGMTRSPADIFLTSLLVVSFCACLVVWGKKIFEATPSRSTPYAVSLALSAGAGIAGAGGLFFIGKIVEKIVFNSNVSLLRWSLNGTFLLLHMGLLLFILAALGVMLLVFRKAFLVSRNDFTTSLIILGLSGAGIFFLGPPQSVFLVLLSLAIVAGISFIVRTPSRILRREALFFGLILIALFLARTIEGQSALRVRNLLETSLRQTILSQQIWGNFLLEQSFGDLDRRQKDLAAYFKNPAFPDFAHSLWEDTPVAKFNWYSSLELRDGEGNVLTRFSLNVPKPFGGSPLLEPSPQWATVFRPLPFIGKQKDFLIGYKDWYEEDHYLGRLVLYVALDPDTLPFLYSANPYFEVLRTNPLPSLNQYDFGCAVYDLDGDPLFNPNKIETAPSPEEIGRLLASGLPSWTTFREKGTDFDSYLFRDRNKLFRLFTARKGFKTQAVEFLRIFLFYSGIALGALLSAAVVFRRARLKEPFRSFSNRVYAAFLASALVPLLLFSVFTRNLFDRIFTERFFDDASVHASFARSLLEDFLIIQGEEISPYLAPSEDLVLLFSSTLSNDVNLYNDATLLASSRREFFDGGLLPDLLDGETYYSLVYEKKPYDTHRTRIGDYSFQTLTVPYPFRERDLFISLPFPFEKEETARATEEIVEFLVLLSSLLFLLIFLFSRGVRTMIIVPIRKLLAGTREVSLGNLEVTIGHRSRDEMMTLIDGFNTMIRDLKTREQDLAEMSKKVAWTEMARKVAHEIKNPLTPIQLSAEHTLKVFEDRKGDFEKTLRESMSYIISEVENLRKIAQDFMEISRDTSLRKDPLNLREVVLETLEPYRKLLSERIQFEVGTDDGYFGILGDKAKLQTAFRNIVTNAVEAIGGEGNIRVEIRRNDDELTVSIRDSGPGISRETLERIFDPYFSTKQSGTGLGLPISKKIIEDHGGMIRIASEKGMGTVVAVILHLHK